MFKIPNVMSVKPVHVMINRVGIWRRNYVSQIELSENMSLLEGEGINPPGHSHLTYLFMHGCSEKVQVNETRLGTDDM